jgi:hypothetical protein
MSILKFFSRPAEQAEVGAGVQSSRSPYLEPPPLASTEQSLPYEKEEVLVNDNTRKRKWKAHVKFATAVKAANGLDLKPATEMGGRPASLCASCLTGSTSKHTVMRNVLARWISHAKSCPGLGKTVTSTPEAQAFVLQCMAGGDKHRRITCDAYTTTYWIYKYKLPFRTSPKLKEVYYTNPNPNNPNPNPNDDVLVVQLLQSLNCVDKSAVAYLSSSKTTCARHGLALCEYLKGKSVRMMENVASISIMFDEASDIQMHKGTKGCAKVIPDEVITLITMLYEYFVRSPARKKAMRDFIAVENEANKLARLRVRLQRDTGTLPQSVINKILSMSWSVLWHFWRSAINCRGKLY